MTLSETQELFYSLVVGDGERATGRALGSCFSGTQDRPAVERIDIYRNMYLWRLVDSLRADFAKLVALLGDNGFFELAAAYARCHPSEHFDIGQFGRALPTFLRTHPELVERPDAADLAELEWARTEVLVEAHAAPLALEALIDLLASKPDSARIALVPALRVLRLEHDVLSVFRRLEDGAPAPDPVGQPTSMAVWRREHDVYHTRLDPDEATALEHAHGGATLAEVCATFLDRKDPAHAAFTALSSWVNEGFIAAG